MVRNVVRFVPEEGVGMEISCTHDDHIHLSFTPVLEVGGGLPELLHQWPFAHLDIRQKVKTQLFDMKNQRFTCLGHLKPMGRVFHVQMILSAPY